MDINSKKNLSNNQIYLDYYDMLKKNKFDIHKFLKFYLNNYYIKYIKKSKFLPVDKFFYNVLYDKKFGYYNSTIPFGPQGDFVTSPNISNLFSEMIAIWIISTWELFGKPKKINVVELGPGDGSLVKVLIKVFKRFPEFNLAKRIYLFDESKLLKKFQKKNIKNSVKWIDDFNSIKGAPAIFFGNEFFDAIPIKQFKREKNILFERNFFLEKNNKISEIYKKASNKDAFDLFTISILVDMSVWNLNPKDFQMMIIFVYLGNLFGFFHLVSKSFRYLYK